MASATLDRPVRLIRVQPNPVFQEPKYLPIKPLTQAPIEIERPSDYLTSCIHRGNFKDIHPDLLKDYAKYYEIEIDHEKVLRAEIMAVLCMKNEWIPILPEHDPTYVESEQVLPSESTTATQPTPEGDDDAQVAAKKEPYVPDRFCTPEDSYDNDAGPSTEAADPKSKDADDDDIDFDMLPSSISLRDLAKLTSRLRARHTRVQCALRDATAATREASANVLEMMARLENEKVRMKKLIGAVADIVGEYDEKIEPKKGSEKGKEGKEGKERGEGQEEEVDEEAESNAVSEKRKGKRRATEPIRSSAHSSFRQERDDPDLQLPPLCPNCRVARDLTVSQHHSIYLCAEHMPNPYQANEAPTEDSQVPTMGSSSNTNDKGETDLSSSDRSTIIFGMTTKPVSTSNSSSKGKKRSLEETEADPSSSNSTSPNLKRARVERSNGITQGRKSQKNSSPTSTPTSKQNAPLRRTIPVGDSSNPVVEREERSRGESPPSYPKVFEDTESSSQERGGALMRRFTINDFEDLEEVAEVARMEASSSSAPRSDTPAVATPTRNAPLTRALSVIDVNNAEELVNSVREQRQPRGRRPRQTPAINNPIQQPSTSNTGRPLRRTVSVQDLSDPEEVANAEREENFPASGIPTPGPTLSEGLATARGQVSPTPRTTNERVDRGYWITHIPESTPSPGSSSPNTSGKRPRDSDDDDEEGGQKRIQKKGRLSSD